MAASVSIAYQRASNMFLVHNGGLSPKRVSENQLRAIGDMDINDAIETAWLNPYTQIRIVGHAPKTGRRIFA